VRLKHCAQPHRSSLMHDAEAFFPISDWSQGYGARGYGVVAATVLTVFDAAPSTRAGPYASGGFSAGPFLSCAPSFYEDSSGNCIEDLISTRTATLVSAAMALARTRSATAVHAPAMGSVSVVFTVWIFG
jgi:hypothetical protein